MFGRPVWLVTHQIIGILVLFFTIVANAVIFLAKQELAHDPHVFLGLPCLLFALINVLSGLFRKIPGFFTNRKFKTFISKILVTKAFVYSHKINGHLSIIQGFAACFTGLTYWVARVTLI